MVSALYGVDSCYFVQESLVGEVVPDPMEGEQTWPTEEELMAAKGERDHVLGLCDRLHHVTYRQVEDNKDCSSREEACPSRDV